MEFSLSSNIFGNDIINVLILLDPKILKISKHYISKYIKPWMSANINVLGFLTNEYHTRRI